MSLKREGVEVMQWSQIKTLFILTFLVLNIYLSMQFISKQKQSDLGILEHGQSTFEEVLESENIKVPSTLPEEAKERFISVRQKAFTEDDIENISGLKQQEIAIVNENLLLSIFDEPINIPETVEDSPDEIKGILQDTIMFPEDYVFWNWNKELNILVFFQKENDRPVYFNQSGMILVFLDEQNDTVFYTQTMLDESDDEQEQRKLIDAIDAIEKLYNASELNVGDEVATVDIGFHTRVPLTNGVQVFVPVWKVTVDDDRDYFVNAIEGHVFSSDELTFLEESMELDLERLEEMENHKDMKEQLETFLEKRLELIYGGDIE